MAGKGCRIWVTTNAKADPLKLRQSAAVAGCALKHQLILSIYFCFCVFTVPVDVFSPNSEWSGFYEYLGKRQATTFTVTGFNASSGRVNVMLLETSGVSIRLSGKNKRDKDKQRVRLIS